MSRFPSVTNGDEGPIDPSPDENVNIAPAATVSTFYTSPWENVSALNDGFDPTSSNDRSHAVYGNWPETGTQWVQYDFDQEYTVSQTDVYWFKDGAGVDVPKSYKIKYWNGRSWSNVKQEFIAELLESDEIRLFLRLDYDACYVHICICVLLNSRKNKSLRMNGCTIVCIMDIRYERKEDRKR
ncbi:discoidin domain-containing protein [Paenibacillus sp. Lou8.1]|nr:discoidin domain-containing protein [Paenibacillus sp. Lou8.1]MCP3809457.1 discoidin domain-containing protein [Paenibacillus sp. Lou8.1]